MIRAAALEPHLPTSPEELASRLAPRGQGSGKCTGLNPLA